MRYLHPGLETLSALVKELHKKLEASSRLIPDHPAPVPGTITRLSGIRVVGRVAVSVGGESEDH